jgi:hypothetical protein
LSSPDPINKTNWITIDKNQWESSLI